VYIADAVSGSDSKASDDRMIDEEWTGNDMEVSGYPDRDFRGFTKFLQANAGIVFWATTASFEILPVHHSPVTFSFDAI
jgi:hypothetical protein